MVAYAIAVRENTNFTGCAGFSVSITVSILVAAAITVPVPVTLHFAGSYVARIGRIGWIGRLARHHSERFEHLLNELFRRDDKVLILDCSLNRRFTNSIFACTIVLIQNNVAIRRFYPLQLLPVVISVSG